MKLIDKKTTIEYFAAPGPEELAAWCRENDYIGVNPDVDSGRDDLPSDRILAAALWYARAKYPGTSNLDVCSYAGLVAYLATGWYGGFGTEEYQKERQAENIVLSLVDGISLEPDGPGEKLTTRILEFLDSFYFGDTKEAIAEIQNYN